MKDRLFKSAFRGFKKNDVLKYIEENDDYLSRINAEVAELRANTEAALRQKQSDFDFQVSRVSELEGMLEHEKSVSAQLQREYAKLQQELSSLREEMENKAEECKLLEAKNVNLFEEVKKRDSAKPLEASVLTDKNRQIDDLRAENARLCEKLRQAEEKAAANERQGDYANIVSDAVIEAGKILENAKNQAEDMIKRVKYNAYYAKKELTGLSSSVYSANVEVTNSVERINEIFDILYASLDTASGNAEDEKDAEGRAE